MRHLTRDFLTISSASCPGTNMYALTIFLVGCGGYSFVGQTNFDVQSGSLQVASGADASIVGTSPVLVQLPTASHVVSAADLNRILALRSVANPLFNSGLFRVTGYTAINNTLTVDYRSTTGSIAESNLSWRLYVDEVTASWSWRSGSNATTGYGSFSPAPDVVSNASRVILRSPDPSSWQVRMCLESNHDVSGCCPSGFSIAPGFGGNGNGDFFEAPSDRSSWGGQKLHLHTALFYNSSDPQYRGMVVGLSPALESTGSWRISMMVDDLTGSCVVVNRNVSLPTAVTSGSGWAAFGLCEDDRAVPSPNNLSDPSLNVRRLFVAGSSNRASSLTWTSQFHADNNIQVVGFGRRGYPVPGVLSCYSDISNPDRSHVRYLTSSAASAWTGTTELFDVEVLIGTVDQSVSASATAIFPLQPARLGRLPMLLQGGANASQWSVYGDHYHTIDGVYLSWGGPTPAGANVLAAQVTSGSTLLQEGLATHAASSPGSDPVLPETSPRVDLIDATRYRKTYSYYRQVPVNTRVAKGG